MLPNAEMVPKELIFVVKISCLPKYRVKYYDYIVNWCSLINCNWCVSLDIAQMLALTSKQPSAWTFFSPPDMPKQPPRLYSCLVCTELLHVFVITAHRVSQKARRL